MFRRLLCTLCLCSATLIADPLVAPLEAGHHRGRYGRYGPGYRYGYGAPSFYFSYGPGFYPSFGIGYGWYPFSIGFGYVPGPKDTRGKLRLYVQPKNAEVYIDGYYAGIVDDFDSSRGQLRLDPGPHDVTIFLEGYRLFQETVNPGAGATVRIRYEMEPLLPGEPPPARPGIPAPAPASPPPPAPPPSPPAGAVPPAMTTPSAPTSPSPSSFGALTIRAQPPDVEVWVNGEPWPFPLEGEETTLHLPTGVYDVELRKIGYETFRTDVEIQPGRFTPLNVRLAATPQE